MPGIPSFGRRPVVRWGGAGVLLTLAVLLGACDHATDTIDGPRLIDRFGEFALVEPLAASRASVDFAAGEAVTFEAQFNKQANWTIEIVGQESGAVKRLEGFSREITDQNARWRGGTTDLPLFRAGESVEATLLVDGAPVDESPSVAVEVATARTYPGEVVTGFEPDDEANLFLGNFEFDFDLTATGPSMEVPAAEGDLFYLLRGTDNTLDNFFVGLLQITSPSEDGYFAVPTSVPEELFFNAFIYNFGSGNTIPILELAVDSNGNGSFDDGIDAIFSTAGEDANNIPFDTPGWSLYSRSAAQLGLTQEQAQQIVAIRAVLISDNTTQPTPRLPVDFGVDYLTFTAGDPLEL